VIPVFAKVFAGFNAELPLITRGCSGSRPGWSSGGLCCWRRSLACGYACAYLRTAGGRYRWDSRKLKLPIVGDIILKATLARFARSFALSSQSGVPLVQALTVVAQTVDNAYIGSRIEQMRDGIERGESISRCAAATGVFTPVVLQMINVGEETGELDSLLFEIAGMYERETDYNIKGLSAAIEPMLLAVGDCGAGADPGPGRVPAAVEHGAGWPWAACHRQKQRPKCKAQEPVHAAGRRAAKLRG
jgi:MSHA biogenesis protein MshG